MGNVIKLAHARASVVSRAAKAVRNSAVSPFSDARSVAKIADHHSAGTLSRCHHLETAEAPAPMSDAIASRDGQSSMTALKDEGKSVIADLIGRSVLGRKPKSSQDGAKSLGHTVLMTADEIRRGFIQRTREARMSSGLSQPQIAKKLGIDQGTYKNYETIRPLPHELVPFFCEICEITPVDLYPAAKKARRTA